jgi:methylphosphotriester-DNA--protein-cysteine methyltransferase
MWRHDALTDAELFGLLRSRAILLAGNCRARIYGRLECASGKRLLRQNRVFFRSEQEALVQDYRPCRHCMR